MFDFGASHNEGRCVNDQDSVKCANRNFNLQRGSRISAPTWAMLKRTPYSAIWITIIGHGSWRLPNAATKSSRAVIEPANSALSRQWPGLRFRSFSSVYNHCVLAMTQRGSGGSRKKYEALAMWRLRSNREEVGRNPTK